MNWSVGVEEAETPGLSIAREKADAVPVESVAPGTGGDEFLDSKIANLFESFTEIRKKEPLLGFLLIWSIDGFLQFVDDIKGASGSNGHGCKRVIGQMDRHDDFIGQPILNPIQ